MSKSKLIWEMRGFHAQGTAEHHAVHLVEYAERNQIELFDSGTEKISDLFSIAFMTIPEENLEVVEKSLKPHHVESLK